MTVARLRQWWSRNGTALVFGLGLTLAAAAAHLLRLTESYELLVYDWYVRNYSSIPASGAIVHIDIDDDSLERVGAWPWPRDVQGELVSILHELGARRIALDLVFPEPKSREVRIPALGPYDELQGDIKQIGELSAENIVSPDDELAAALLHAGNAYLSFHYRTAAEEKGATPLDPGLAGRMTDLLRADFDLSRDQLAARLKVTPDQVERVLAGVKRRTALELVEKVLRVRSNPSAREVHEAISRQPFERETADRADILFAFLRQSSILALQHHCEPVPPGLQGRLPQVREVIPPLMKFVDATRHDGFVRFDPDIEDGRTRRVPLMMDWNGVLLKQLGFAVACDELDIRPEDMSRAAGGPLLIAARGNRAAMRVPVDENGQLLINWTVRRAARWDECFRHVPVTQLLRIYDCRKSMRENDSGRQIRLGELIRLIRGDDGFALYRRQVNSLLEQEQAIRKARLADRNEAELAPWVESAARLRKQVETDQADTVSMVRDQWKEFSSSTRPAEAALATEYDRFKQAAELIDGQVAAYERANENIRAAERDLLARLRPVIQSKICFVGYTATAVADMVNTPAYARMPGVLVHSNVTNSFLQNQFRDQSPRWVQTLTILLLGILASVLAATFGPRESLLLVVALLIFLLLFNGWLLFEWLSHWLRLVTAMVGLLAVWAGIVVVRYLTVERGRRRFSRAVAQYVSPAMAQRIASSTEDFDLSPVSGHVTCFFSDLAGFTRLSERLGPEGTRTVLNPYLEAMSSVLHRHQGMINKFIGDGIFAFFNPPILPCAGHERQACAAAIESERALRELKEKHAHDHMAHEFEQLAMRIGIGAGPVFVGDYGSENKLDYTCMGDTVNLASRLEGANKIFGTTVMVNGTARDAVGDAFAFRPLGALQVKGQTVAVPVYELLGYAGQVDPDVIRFSEMFKQAVEAFGQRDWSVAARALQQCSEWRPGDPGVLFYQAAIAKYMQHPPGDEWNGGVELTEK